MTDARLLDEEQYFQARDADLLEEADRRGISRRALIGAAATGLPLLAGSGRWALPEARADSPPAVPAGPIVKPLPPEWFTIIGTNAEMRWDSVAGQPYIGGPVLPNAWVRWRAEWTPTVPGSYELQARATDSTGQTQPPIVPFNDLGYLFWAIVKHPVVVT